MKKYPLFLLISLFGCAGISVLPDAVVEGKVTIAPLCGQAAIRAIQLTHAA